MSKELKKFKVPDQLANLYDFANSLDVRHFTHHGVQHVQGDELTQPRELVVWMARRGLLFTAPKITADMLIPRCSFVLVFGSIWLVTPVSAPETRKPSIATATMRLFPLVVKATDQRGAVLQPCRDDALSGLSVVAAELYDGAIQGTLDRLKMCAAEECRRVFFDRSKPATRRWCTSTLCGNRMKTKLSRASQPRRLSCGGVRVLRRDNGRTCRPFFRPGEYPRCARRAPPP